MFLGPNKVVETASGSPSNMCSFPNLFNAFITPGPMASPQDLSLGNSALSKIAIFN